VLLNKPVELPKRNDKRTKLHWTWECSFLREWIQMFGEDKTRRDWDNIMIKYNSFWEIVANSMNDGELLHIVIELESIKGVQWTASLGMIGWRDGNNRTAMDLAKEKIGEGHVITRHRQGEVENLTLCGYFDTQ